MKNQYRVAVLVYPEGDKHLVFQDNPEVVVLEDAPCESEADITAAAATVARVARNQIDLYETPSDMDDDSDDL